MQTCSSNYFIRFKLNLNFKLIYYMYIHYFYYIYLFFNTQKLKEICSYTYINQFFKFNFSFLIFMSKAQLQFINSYSSFDDKILLRSFILLQRYMFLMQLVDTKYDLQAYDQIFRFFMRDHYLSTGRPRLKPSSFQSKRCNQQERNSEYALRRGLKRRLSNLR